LVRERLAGPGNVAVALRFHLVQRQRRARGHVVDGLLARPPLRMDSGVDDEAAGTPHLVRQPSEVVVRIGVEAGLEAEPLAIEAPSLAERGDIREAAKIRQVAE